MRFWISKRRSVYYLVDSLTNKKESLRTSNRTEAKRIQLARNQAVEQPSLNLALGRAFLSAHDREMPQRTWGQVMEELCSRGKTSTRERNCRAMASKPFRLLLGRKIVETTAADFLEVLKLGSSSTNPFLRQLHNLALGLGWLPWPVLPKNRWPVAKWREKRAILLAEHHALVAAERSAEWRLYLEVLWETGAAQTDAALLQRGDIDYAEGTLSYRRCKTRVWATLKIGDRLAGLFDQLPASGGLFPSLAPMNDSRRAWHFARLCKREGIDGVTLHSYRYAWAERARSAGYPERWAQAALGHNSRAVHQAYARKARVICPSLDQYEKTIVTFPKGAAVG